MEQEHGHEKCACMHHKMLPLFIILIGLSFLLKALGVISVATNDYIWPILLILLGLKKMFCGMCKCCSTK